METAGADKRPALAAANAAKKTTICKKVCWVEGLMGGFVTLAAIVASGGVGCKARSDADFEESQAFILEKLTNIGVVGVSGATTCRLVTGLVKIISNGFLVVII
mgnify:CR=1 FL=1